MHLTRDFLYTNISQGFQSKDDEIRTRERFDLSTDFEFYKVRVRISQFRVSFCSFRPRRKAA